MARARGIRRSIAVGGLSLGSLAAIAPGAHAASNFGGQSYSPSFTNGGRVAIATPPDATTESAADDEIFAHRIAVEGYNFTRYPFPVGLAQTGLYRSGRNAHVDNCDSSVDKYTYYVEILPADGNYTFKCALYGQAGFGNDTEFKVTGDGSGRYQLGGVNIQTNSSFATPWVPLQYLNGQTYISTELNNGSGVTADRSRTNAVYGGGAYSQPSWYVYRQPSYGDPHLVAPSETTEILPHGRGTGSEGTWYVPDVPTPVRFKHAP
jgi:hypothetical protein